MTHEPKKLRQRHQGKNNHRLIVERLECRRLLAGLNVSVTIDTSLTGNLNSQVEVPAANRIVYVDLNRNGWADGDEPVAITNEAGNAFFEGLEAGDYSISLLTDNYHQRQITPAVVEITKQVSVPLSSQWLIGGTDPGQSLWGLSQDGILTLISDASPNSDGRGLNYSILQIGGQPTSVAQRTPTEAWISYNTDSHSRLAIFNSATKQLASYYISNSTKIVDLASDGQSVFGVVKAHSQSDVVQLELTSRGLALTEIVSGQISDIDIVSDRLVAIRQAGNNKFLDLMNLNGQRIDSISIPGSASRLTADSLTKSIAVDSSEGILVFSVSEDEQLTQVAIIAEAVGPIAMSTGRMIASNRTRQGELTVWNMSNWSPVGHHLVADVDIRNVRMSGLEALVLTNNNLLSLNLAASQPFQVTLVSDETRNAKFSVHQIASTSPSVASPQIRSILENDSESVDLRQLMTDANGQTLWFSVVTHPTHGAVQLTASGKLEFTPHANFFGRDSATIRVHDGISSADVSLNWNIIEANRPPEVMEVSIQEVAESLAAGTIIGTVSIVDPNTNDSYKITSSDRRFRVVNGNVVLNEPLDFEAGASISIDLTAIDALGKYSITRRAEVKLINVVEAPEGVVLSQLSIPENVSGVVVGNLDVVLPDARGDYSIHVDDARFKVLGNRLWLTEPLNYEQAQAVKLKLTVVDTNHPSIIVSNQTTLTVTNRDDKPTGIEISSRKVPEQTFGAVVGTITVADEDGDTYQYSVSDERFVVADGVLSLAEDRSLDLDVESSIPIVVTATTPSGGIIILNFPLTVTPPPSPWQNPLNSIDVNGDDVLTPIDALLVINFLNLNGPGTVPPTEPGANGEPPVFLDPSGDRRITAIDALIIINALNASRNSGGSGEDRLGGDGEAFDGDAQLQVSPWNTDEERKKQNSKIDAELEQLLDQLAKDPNAIVRK
jgi:Dockerin type I domain/Bacterial Ig domain